MHLWATVLVLFSCQTWWHQSASNNLLRKIADCKLSFAELKQHASEINDLQVPKTEFVKKTGCKSWKEAGERYLAIAS